MRSFFKDFARTCQIALPKGLGQSQMRVGEGEGRWEELRRGSRGVPEGQHPAVSIEAPRGGLGLLCGQRMVNGDRKGTRLYFAAEFSIWDNDL